MLKKKKDTPWENSTKGKVVGSRAGHFYCFSYLKEELSFINIQHEFFLVSHYLCKYLKTYASLHYE